VLVQSLLICVATILVSYLVVMGTRSGCGRIANFPESQPNQYNRDTDTQHPQRRYTNSDSEQYQPSHTHSSLRAPCR
jgi:hypothetical protein